jgi:hypothetical protein
MPARPSHIPHASERSTLQRMSPNVGTPSEKLYPAGKQTIAKMVAKGWIERQSDAGPPRLLHNGHRTRGPEGANTERTMSRRERRC